ncbi:MAG TPA: hypothetical protein VF528_01975 [Pyrinomonadaceae bacterium]|jgi:hypothetical protein
METGKQGNRRRFSSEVDTTAVSLQKGIAGVAANPTRKFSQQAITFRKTSRQSLALPFKQNFPSANPLKTYQTRQPAALQFAARSQSTRVQEVLDGYIILNALEKYLSYSSLLEKREK